MKKIILLSSLLLLTMVGCSQPSSSSSTTTSKEEETTTSVETTTSEETTTSINQELMNAKNEAKKVLQDYVEQQTIEDKTQLNTLLNSLLVKIDEASSVEQVNTEKENGLALLQELANTLKEMEILKEKRLEAINTLDSIDLSNFDDEGVNQANSLISKGKEDIYSADTEEDINQIVSKVKEDIAKIKTKTEKFYDQMVNEVSPEAFSFADDKISGGNLEGATEFHMGKQDGNTSSVVDFYININYKNVEWSMITFKFRKWDNNSTLEVVAKDASLVFDSVVWNNGAVKTEIENKSTGIKANTKTHVQILSCGWQKTVLIDDVKMFSFNSDKYCVGYFGISSWEASYTIENALYQEYDDNTMNEKYGSLLF